MSGEGSTTLIGNLVADPETRFTTSGHAVANLRVASTSRKFDKVSNKYVDAGDPLYLDITCWRHLAEDVADLHRGDRVVVVGRLKSRTYEAKDGSTKTVVEMEADEIAKSVRRRQDHPSPPRARADEHAVTKPPTDPFEDWRL